MFKRVTWMVTGIGVGLGSARWLERKVQQKVARYAPERLAGDLASSARRLGTDLRGAVAEGRDAMRAREVELRAGPSWRPRSTHQAPPRRSHRTRQESR